MVSEFGKKKNVQKTNSETSSHYKHLILLLETIILFDSTLSTLRCLFDFTLFCSSGE